MILAIFFELSFKNKFTSSTCSTISIFKTTSNFSLEIKSFVGNTEAVIRVSCSKGTYIRSLVESIGKKINTIATIKELRRISVGEFKEEDLTLLESKEKSFYQQSWKTLNLYWQHLEKRQWAYWMLMFLIYVSLITIWMELQVSSLPKRF